MEMERDNRPVLVHEGGGELWKLERFSKAYPYSRKSSQPVYKNLFLPLWASKFFFFSRSGKFDLPPLRGRRRRRCPSISFLVPFIQVIAKET